ncbi:MAG: hypothetical protein L0154_06655 [Chloroflexi bacterium]|nr:hypothetical protein [Chloroflexota bacterium]
MTGTIFLIVEDQTDADIVRALLKAKDVDVKITPLLPSGGSGGLSPLAKDLEKLMKTAIARHNSGDCIAVLHDADLNIEPTRNLYDKIKDICDRYNNDVVPVLAKVPENRPAGVPPAQKVAT